MNIQNSLVIADFIRGLFIPIGIISLVCFVAIIPLIIYGGIEDSKKALRWGIACGIELLCAIWFFSTFTITQV